MTITKWSESPIELFSIQYFGLPEWGSSYWVSCNHNCQAQSRKTAQGAPRTNNKNKRAALMTKMPLVLAMQSSGPWWEWREYSTAITVRSKTVVLSYNTNDNRLKIDPLSTITAKVFTVTIQYNTQRRYTVQRVHKNLLSKRATYWMQHPSRRFKMKVKTNRRLFIGNINQIFRLLNSNPSRFNFKLIL